VFWAEISSPFVETRHALSLRMGKCCRIAKKAFSKQFRTHYHYIPVSIPKNIKTDKMSQQIKRPSLFLFATEGIRVIWELVSSIGFRRDYTPERTGDGHAVLVIPGLFGADVMMQPMRKFLRRLGYTPYKWGQGINTADPKDLEALVEKVDALYEKHQEKISIVGWSLGGIYARELTKRRGDKVRQVITTGSPFRGIENPNNVVWLFKLLKGNIDDIWDRELVENIPEPTPVLTTSIYSKKDGIVRWQDCMCEAEDPLHRNEEAVSSHLGMPHNTSVLKIIADRLPDKVEGHNKHVPSQKRRV